MKSVWITTLAIVGLSMASCQNTIEGAKEDAKINTPTKDQVADAGAAIKLTPTIKAAIIASPILNDSANKIDVDTNESTVTLSGTVKTADMKAEAEKIAESILTKTSSPQKLEDKLTVGK